MSVSTTPPPSFLISASVSADGGEQTEVTELVNKIQILQVPTDRKTVMRTLACDSFLELLPRGLENLL